MSMNMNEYQKLAARTINDKLDYKQQELHALHGMVGEIGDLLWFIAELCTVNYWELDEIAEMNIEKLRQRYPQGFDTEKSLHRAEGDI